MIMSKLSAFFTALKALCSRMDWQHWVLLGTLLVTGVGPDVVNALSQGGFPSQAASLSHVLALVAGVLALAKQLAPQTPPSVPGATGAHDTDRPPPLK
jgi:hypothetical protein